MFSLWLLMSWPLFSLSVKQDSNHQLFSVHNYVVKYIGYLKTFHLVK